MGGREGGWIEGGGEKEGRMFGVRGGTCSRLDAMLLKGRMHLYNHTRQRSIVVPVRVFEPPSSFRPRFGRGSSTRQLL